jgi:Mce-associated membrane protein
VLAIVSFLGAVAMAVVAARVSGELSRVRDDRRGAEQAAARFASRFSTYDYQHLDTTRQAVLRLSTGKFKSEYEQAFSGLNQLIMATKAKSSVTVKNVFSGEVEGSTGTVVVVLDQTVEGLSGTRRSLDSWIELDLVKGGSRWLIDNVTNLNFGQTQASAAPATTTTTEAPRG